MRSKRLETTISCALCKKPMRQRDSFAYEVDGENKGKSYRVMKPATERLCRKCWQKHVVRDGALKR